MKNENALWVQANAKDLEIIDVRTPAEFAISHIPGATNIHKDELIINHSNYLNKDKEYYIMCGSGGRSQSTIKALFKQGYKMVNVSKGISGMDSTKLIKEDKPLTRADGRLMMDHIKPTKINFVILYAENCGTCKLLKPILETLDKKYEDVSTIALKVTDHQDIIFQEKIAGTPITFVFLNEKEIFNFKGYLSEVEILKKIQEYK